MALIPFACIGASVMASLVGVSVSRQTHIENHMVVVELAATREERPLKRARAQEQPDASGQVISTS